MKKLIGAVSAVLSLLIIFSSCNLDNGTTNPQTGFFLVANVSPDAPHLDIFINNAKFDTGMAYGNYTPYVSATAGVYNFSVYPAGSGTSVLNNNLSIAANKVYSYFVIDSFSKVQSALVEDNIIAPSGDSVFVRFFNFSPNLPPVDVIDSAGTAGGVPGSVLFSIRGYNGQANNPNIAVFNELKQGTYTLQLKPVGDTIVYSTHISLTGGKVITLFAKGFKGGTGDQALGIGQMQNYP